MKSSDPTEYKSFVPMLLEIFSVKILSEMITMELWYDQSWMYSRLLKASFSLHPLDQNIKFISYWIGNPFRQTWLKSNVKHSYFDVNRYFALLLRLTELLMPDIDWWYKWMSMICAYESFVSVFLRAMCIVWHTQQLKKKKMKKQPIKKKLHTTYETELMEVIA